MKEEYSNQNTFLSMIDMDLIRQGLLHAIQDLVFILKVIDDETFKYMYVNRIGMDYARLSEECYGKLCRSITKRYSGDIAKAI